MRFLSLILTASLAVPAAALSRAPLKYSGKVKTAAVPGTFAVPQMPRVAVPQQFAPFRVAEIVSPQAARLPASALSVLKAISASVAPPAAVAARPMAASEAGAAKAAKTAGRAMDGSGEFSEAADPRGPPQPQAAGTQRRLEDIQRLKVGTYNVLNLFEMVGKWVPDPNHAGRRIRVTQKELKPDWQLRESAKAILEMDLDIMTLQEVENVKALEQFNQKYLGGAYRTLLIEGNDERGIDVGFLVKDDIPFELEHRSHKKEPWNDPQQGGREVPLFSRDLPSLVVRAPGRAQPLFVMFGTHFKSKRDRAGDPQSRKLRRAQVERAAEIILRYRKEFGEKVPILLAGDFNGELNKEPEFEALRRVAGLIDGLDLARPPLPYIDRVTHTYHPPRGPADKKQMDAVTVSESMKGLVAKAWVYRYKDEHGNVKPLPETYKEREKNPSDHFPVVIELEFQPLLGRP